MPCLDNNSFPFPLLLMSSEMSFERAMMITLRNHSRFLPDSHDGLMRLSSFFNTQFCPIEILFYTF